MEVLDEGDLERSRSVSPDDHRQFVKLGLRRAPAPFAGDDLEAVWLLGVTACEDRLQNALLGDRLGELSQILLANLPPRLKPARPQMFDRHCARRAFRFGAVELGAVFAEQRRKAPTQTTSFRVRRHQATCRSRRSTSPARCR